MAFNPNREEKLKKEFISKCIWMMILSFFAGLYLGAEAKYYELQGSNFIENIDRIFTDTYTMREIELLGHTLKLPGILCLYPVNWGWVAIITVLGATYLLNEYIQYILNKNRRPGEEHGSSKFNTNYEQFTHDYIMSAPTLKEGLADGQMKITLKEKLMLKFIYPLSGAKDLLKKKKEAAEDKKEWEQMDTEQYGTNAELEAQMKQTKIELDEDVLLGKQHGDKAL